MKKKIIWGIIIIIAAGVLFRIGIFVKQKLNPEVKGKEKRVVSVKAAGVSMMNMTDSIKLTGDIRGIEVVNVFSQVPGKVQEILIKQGQKVYKNQTVIKINRDIVGMEYMPAIVEAPISGYVGNIMVDRGMTISNSTPLAQLVNMSSVEAVVQIIEEDINRVQTGMAAIIKVEAFHDRTFTGRVYKKSAVLDAVSRTQEAHILINNKNLELKHGMFADVEIIAGRKNNVLAVPVDCVMKDEKGNAFVYIVVNDMAKKQKVITGLTARNYTEIKEGINRNAVVVTLGKENISDGEYLKVYREDIPETEKANNKIDKGGAK